MKQVLIEVIGPEIKSPVFFDTFEEAYDRMAERAYEEAGGEPSVNPNCSCDFGATEVHCDNIYEERCGWKIFKVEEKQTNSRPIDRDYALKQAELGIKEANTDEEKATFIRLRDFLKVLPSPEDLDQLVYCTECGHFSADEEHLNCPYESLCYFWNPEDSMPRRVRWCYVEKI